MRIAVHGFVAEGVGSSAGSFAFLLRELLEAGHHIDFYGIPRFTEPSGLQRYPNYRYVPLAVPWVKSVGAFVRRLGDQYSRAVHSSVWHIAYQREATVRAQAATPAADFLLCLDTLQLWPCRLPVVSWPQSPPHTEWAALREPAIRRAVRRASGSGYYAAVQAFYAYRFAQARLTLGYTDALVCGSHWAAREWLRFGLRAEQTHTVAYPLEMSELQSVPPPGQRQTTFLWLGRAVPRKRLDLFLAAFELVRKRHPGVRALLVGKLRGEGAHLELLDRYRGDPDVIVGDPVPRHEVSALFARADVLVQPSQNENFGFSVAEALGAGRPIVVGPTNGTGDFGGLAAFRFDAYRPAAIALAMEAARAAVLADGERVASNARAAARAAFTPPEIAARLCEVGRLAIERHARRKADTLPSHAPRPAPRSFES